jgi:hypothetical protein
VIDHKLNSYNVYYLKPIGSPLNPQRPRQKTLCQFGGLPLETWNPRFWWLPSKFHIWGTFFLEQCIMELNNLELTLRFLVQVFAWMGCQSYGCFFWCLLLLNPIVNSTQPSIHPSIHQGCDVVHPNDVRANNMLHVGWKCERWYVWTSLIGLEKANYKQIKYLHIVLHNNIIQIFNTWQHLNKLDISIIPCIWN